MSNTRLGIFYDGGYFDSVNRYYKQRHPKESRIWLGAGFNNFIRYQIAARKKCDIHDVELVESHFFQSWLHAADTPVERQLYQFQKFEILLNHGITPHHLPMGINSEKGIDVLLALECFEIAAIKHQLDTVCLVAGDGDFIPLVRKLREHGVQVMVLGWNFSYTHEGKERVTRISRRLLDEVIFPLEIDEPYYYQNTDRLTDKEKRAYDGIFKRFTDSFDDGELNKASPEKQEPPAAGEVGMPHTSPPVAVAVAAAAPTAQPSTPDSQPVPAPEETGDSDESKKWHKGVIHNTQIRYGFITPAEEGENLYFSHDALIEGRFHELFRGQDVVFEKGVGKTGKTVAVKVKLLRASAFSASASHAPTVPVAVSPLESMAAPIPALLSSPPPPPSPSPVPVPAAPLIPVPIFSRVQSAAPSPSRQSAASAVVSDHPVHSSVASAHSSSTVKSADFDEKGNWKQGIIDNVNRDRGFGFITPFQGQENLFFHYTALPDGILLSDMFRHQRVRFKEGQGINGDTIAIEVDPLEAPPAAMPAASASPPPGFNIIKTAFLKLIDAPPADGSKG